MLVVANINFTMLVDATILMLLYLQGAYSQEERTCGSSLEMRGGALDKQLAAVGCESYSCGKLNLILVI